jgi:hypothetical protein
MPDGQDAFNTIFGHLTDYMQNAAYNINTHNDVAYQASSDQTSLDEYARIPYTTVTTENGEALEHGLVMNVEVPGEDNQGGGPDMRPASPGSYYNAAGQLIYRDGVVTNWVSPNGNRMDATFIDRKGNRIEFPGVNFTPTFTLYNAGYTLASGMIHLDPANGLEDLEHEYGHRLDQMLNGTFYFVFKVMPLSLINTWINPSTHQNYWTEVGADRLAIQFFGPNSAIANSKYYPH